MDNRLRPRILIADDHKLVAEACKSLLEPEFEVVGIVLDGRAVLQSTIDLHPDVILLDIAMPQLNGLDAGEQVKQKAPGVKLIYMTMNAQPELAAEAFRRGAAGYVLKHGTADELVVAVRRVLRGESYLSPLITRETFDVLLRSESAGPHGKRISLRQSEVLQLLAEGKCMKEVAYILHVKPGTVAFHKYRIMGMLGIRSNAELIEYAIKHHLVSK
jgi:DNA-binding NarL/FixJ family response regulator